MDYENLDFGDSIGIEEVVLSRFIEKMFYNVCIVMMGMVIGELYMFVCYIWGEVYECVCCIVGGLVVVGVGFGDVVGVLVGFLVEIVFMV